MHDLAAVGSRKRAIGNGPPQVQYSSAKFGALLQNRLSAACMKSNPIICHDPKPVKAPVLVPSHHGLEKSKSLSLALLQRLTLWWAV